MSSRQRSAVEADTVTAVRVLLCLTDSGLAELTRTYLEREDLTVTVARTTDDAVERTEAGDIDCVVTDIVDTGAPERGLLERIRARQPDIPYVLFTSRLRPSLAVDSLRAGVTDYVERGPDVDQYPRLATRIHEAVSRYRLGRRLAQVDRALDALTEGLAVVDDRGQLVFFNEAFRSSFDLEWTLSPGARLVDVLPAPVVDTLEADLLPTLASAGRWLGELSTDEALFCSATALPDGGYTLVVTPLEHDRATAEVGSLQRRYRSVFTQGFDAMLIADDEGRYVEVNPKACELLGLPRELVLGRRIDEFAEEAFDFDAAWETFLDEGRMEGEFTLVRPDGERRILEFEATTDIVPGEHLSVLRDVTERVEHEAELTRAYKRYHTIVDRLPDLAVVLFDEAGRYLVVDGGGVHTLGIERDVSPGTPVRSAHSDDVATTLEPLYGLVCDGSHLDMEVEVNGRTLSVVARPTDDVDGYRAGVAVFRDVTERRGQEARIREQNERLEEFASIVSHDLRTPLAVASGWLELARVDEDPAEALSRVEDALERMSELVTGVLELARSGAIDPEPSVSLSEVVHAAWSESVHGTDATLETVTDLGAVTADPARLHELFCNLFRNAVEHAGYEASVTVGRLDDGGFYVEDDGSGIPADKWETIFERGYTTDGGGTGLGLYIVARIARAHGWTVEVAEIDTTGARFEVRFDAA